MSDENDETPLDPRLKELAQGYHEPKALDRDAAWKAIAASRQSAVGSRQEVDSRQASGRRRSRGGRMPVLSTRAAAWISGIAALLVLGIGIGRMTAPTVETTTVATAPVTKAPSMALEVAAAQHLSQSEAYLTLFRASVRDGQVDSLPVATARELLATNRLLLDSRVADARLRPLLLDLELVLAEITQLGTSGRQADVKLITDGLDQGDVMMRLRVAPAAVLFPAECSDAPSLGFLLLASAQATAQLAPVSAPSIGPAARAAYQSSLTLVPTERRPASRGEWHQSDPADSLYKAGRNALNKNQYKTAADLFRQVRSRYPKSAYVPDTYYYEAFALYRTGSNADLRQAGSLLETQATKYPKAATAGDARGLMSRIDAQLAQKGDAPAAERMSATASAAAAPRSAPTAAGAPMPPMGPMTSPPMAPMAPMPPMDHGRQDAAASFRAARSPRTARSR